MRLFFLCFLYSCNSVSSENIELSFGVKEKGYNIVKFLSKSFPLNKSVILSSGHCHISSFAFRGLHESIYFSGQVSCQDGENFLGYPSVDFTLPSKGGDVQAEIGNVHYVLKVRVH